MTARTSFDACVKCRERHVKCVEGQTRCKRCEKKNLECKRVKGRFRKGSSANYEARFRNDQQWVTITTTQLNPDVLSASAGRQPLALDGRLLDGRPLQQQHANGREGESAEVVFSDRNNPRSHTNDLELTRDLTLGSPSSSQPLNLSLTTDPEPGQRRSIHRLKSISEEDNLPSTQGEHASTIPDHSLADSTIDAANYDAVSLSVPIRISQSHLMLDFTEACLLRYFVEELAQWFDTNDERRLFHLLVPLRAMHCAPLLYAICAVSTRRIVRDPRYQSPEGIWYEGRLHRGLNPSVAVEYMLKCIPYLFDFSNVGDDEYRENIIAAAVILRQYEEIEKDDENEDTEGFERAGMPIHQTHRTSFLAVTQGIIDNCASSPTFASETLANATFWIAVRQEVYECFINRRSPTMKFALYDMGPVSPANRLVMHAAEVTMWNWGDKTSGEWIRLNEEHEILKRQFQSALGAVWEIGPDVVGGRVYPEIWYTSDAQVVSAQHLELARMILVAEKPTVCPPVTTKPSKF